MKKNILSNYKIITDVNLDLTAKYKKDNGIEFVLQNSDIQNATVSVENYLDSFESNKDIIFVFTISSKLSDNYSTAMKARSQYLKAVDKDSRKKIFVCDTKTTLIGEMRMVLKLLELIKEGHDYSDICVRLMCYRNQLKTYFVHNDNISNESSLDNNTVLSSLDGDIVKVEQNADFSKAVEKMVAILCGDICTNVKRTVTISYCNDIKKAKAIRKMIKKQLGHCKVVLETVKSGDSYLTGDYITVTV